MQKQLRQQTDRRLSCVKLGPARPPPPPTYTTANPNAAQRRVCCDMRV